MRVSGQVVRAPSSVKTTLPEAAKALEQAWQRRRQELAGWQPTNGWLMESRMLVRRSTPAR